MNERIEVHFFNGKGGGGQGGGSPGVMGAGGLWRREKRVREAGYLKGAGTGRNGKNFATLARYFAIGKVRRGGSRYGGGGNLECRVREAGSSDPLSPPPPPHFAMNKWENNWRYDIQHQTDHYGMKITCLK